MNIIGVILKSGILIQVDSEVTRVYTETESTWKEGRHAGTEPGVKVPMTSYLKVEREEHLRFTSKGKEWMVKESEIAAINYEKEEEEEKSMDFREAKAI